MDIEEYRKDFLEQIRSDAALNSTDPNEEFIQKTIDLLVENEAAGLLVVEQLWAKPLKKALIEANGYLIAEGRIHPDAVAELEGEV